ncbi:MAG: mechanosensitive ion channel [Gammaproteobacteria bacterium]|nr:mechanosensitive ion channel [Gammaproteobacteria bacterium]
MLTFITKKIGIFLLAFLVLPLHAAPKVTHPVDQNKPKFDLNLANKQVNALNQQLSAKNISLERLDAAITVLTQFMDKANDCITFSEKKLSSLDVPIDDVTHAKEHSKGGADLEYLHKEQKKIGDQLAQCRLFNIRAQEALDAYQVVVAKTRQKQALTRGMPIWSLIAQAQKNTNKPMLSAPSFHLPVYKTIPFLELSMFLLSLLIATAIIVKIKTKKSLCRILRVHEIGIKEGLLVFLCFLSTGYALFFNLSEPIQTNTTTILTPHLFEITCYYLWALAGVVTLFKFNITFSTFQWYSLNGHFFKNLLMTGLGLYAANLIGRALIQTFNVSNLMWQLSQVTFLLVVILTAMGFLHYFYRTHHHMGFIRNHRRWLQYASNILFIGCMILDMLGYQQLASHLAYAGILTFVILFVMILLEYTIQKGYTLCTTTSKTQSKITNVFGNKTKQTLVEFVILKIALQSIVLLTALYCIGHNWGYGHYYLDSAYSHLINGIHFANAMFYPSRIVMGILIFCVLNLCFRAISTKLSKNAQFENEEETQVAVASILTYTGFAFSLVTALYVSGIDFTGVAIVAGALSVGIGLGLQGIVSNFVSGIILLIEKPIKPGDRISLDGVEGIVKKIRVRSTQITTLTRQDVIIPNSNLLTHPVTNFMFSDRYLSIHCEIGVAYDSDTQLVQKLLLQAAEEHEDVLTSERSKPRVLFQDFGDSAKIFRVWFVIKDGNKKTRVRSDINFKIEQLFKEHNVSIPYPTRDINVRMSDIKT